MCTRRHTVLLVGLAGALIAAFLLVACESPKIAVHESENISTDFKPVRRVPDEGKAADLPTVFVEVMLGVEDSEYARLTTSFLKREIRALGNVRLVEAPADYVISVVTAPLGIEKNEVLKYMVSCVFLIGDANSMRTTEATPTAGLIYHKVWLANPDELQALCQRAIANFDTIVLAGDAQARAMRTRVPPAPAVPSEVEF